MQPYFDLKNGRQAQIKNGRRPQKKMKTTSKKIKIEYDLYKKEDDLEKINFKMKTTIKKII
jgi:hypothetical protein